MNGQNPKSSPVQPYILNRTSAMKGSSERPNSVISFPSVVSGELNVTNPHYAAKYGNPYLRESSAMFDPTFPPPPPHQHSPLLARHANFITLPYKQAGGLLDSAVCPYMVPTHYIHTQEAGLATHV